MRCTSLSFGRRRPGTVFVRRPPKALPPSSMNPSCFPGPSSPTGPHRNDGPSKPLSVPPKQAALIDQPAVRRALRRMVAWMEKNPHTRDDLLQEALLCLWSKERHHPGQRTSWYLQGVEFHLRHLKNSGRSLDSPKHRGAQAAFADSADGPNEWPGMLDLDDGIMSEVNAHDLFALLVDKMQGESGGKDQKRPAIPEPKKPCRPTCFGKCK